METIASKTRKAIRIISFKDKDEPALPLFKKHSILPIEKNLQLKQAAFMWKLNNDMLPKSLASNFRTHRNRIAISHNRLETSTNHITYAGPRLWQALPNDLKTKAFPKSFSEAVKSYLLQNI